MNVFGFDKDSVAERVRTACRQVHVPTARESICLGGLGFAAASCIVFATVVLGEQWLYRNFGILGAYLIWALMFVMLAGTTLARLIIGPGLLLLYAAVWCGLYLGLPRSTPIVTELLASIVAPIAIALVWTGAFGVKRGAWKVFFWLAAAHAAGYFAGRTLHERMGGATGMMLWGVCYGVAFGAGMGYALFRCQAAVRAWIYQTPESMNES